MRALICGPMFVPPHNTNGRTGSIAGETGYFGRRLRRELPRRDQHQRLNAPRLTVDTLDHGYRESRRLSTPGLRQAYNVFTIQKLR